MTERLARIGRQSLKSIGLVNVRDGSRDFGTGDGGGGEGEPTILEKVAMKGNVCSKRR